MRWTTPQHGDYRIKKGFLLFPKEINNVVRWLERATWKQRYGFGFMYAEYWQDIQWVAKPTPEADHA